MADCFRVAHGAVSVLYNVARKRVVLEERAIHAHVKALNATLCRTNECVGVAFKVRLVTLTHSGDCSFLAISNSLVFLLDRTITSPFGVLSVSLSRRFSLPPRCPRIDWVSSPLEKIFHLFQCPSSCIRLFFETPLLCRSFSNDWLAMI